VHHLDLRQVLEMGEREGRAERILLLAQVPSTATRKGRAFRPGEARFSAD